MSLETWLAFCVTELLLCLSPGPAVLLVVSLGLTRGRGPALSGSIGILAANALYFALSATGLGAVLLLSWESFFFIKWLGAAYLIWLGGRMIFAGQPSEPVPRRAPAAKSHGRAFVHGLVAQGANPKLLAFFVALLPQFLDPRHPLGPQVAILAVTSLAIELAILGAYAELACRGGSRVRAAGLSTAVSRLGGGMLVGAGIGLLSLRRAQ